MKKIILVFLIIMLIPFNVQASQEDNNVISPKDDKQVEDLYDYITKMKTEYELLKDMDVKSYVDQYMKSGDSKLSFSNLSKVFISYAFKEAIATIKLMTMLIIIAIICSLLTNLQNAFNNDNISNIAYFACYALIIIIVSKSFFLGVEIARDAINKMTDFMAALIPVLIMLMASVGGFAEAAIMDPIIIGAINICARVFVNFIIPLIFMSFVLQFVNNLSDGFKVGKLTKLLNQIAIWTQGIIMTVFIGIMTIRGITSKTIDQVTAKTAKFAVDNFIPVIGKCLSDAISTVAGYSLLLKNALSSVGLIIILIIVVYPIIKLLIIALMFKITSALIEPISDSKIVNSISSVGDSFLLVMASLICVSTMFFIMISIIASAGKMAVGG